MTFPNDVVSRLQTDPALWPEFAALCDCGGRVAGTASEWQALDLVRAWGAEATGRAPNVLSASYDGWTLSEASLHVVEDGRRTPLACLPLLRSAATPLGGLEAEVLPVGLGREAEFAACGEALRGRIALVRHEYMFSASHVHRRLKYRWAVQHGAAGFLIAGPLPGSVVAGGGGSDIPAMGISPEAAARLSPHGALARAVLRIEATQHPAETETILFDMPGGGDGWVVLSAHIDGHAPGESALDNASGVAVALAVARALAPYVASCRRGLRLAFFSAEEWALTGSRVYLDGLPSEQRAAIALNVNLDTVAGGRRLTALTSECPALTPLVARAAAASGVPIGVYQPLMTNSDHANFAAHGIPALRLVAGFEDPASDVRHVLTAADTRDKAELTELRTAAIAAAAMVWEGLTHAVGS
jgi:aminopeptidase YwaD